MTTPIVVNITDTFEEWRVKTNQISANITANLQSNVLVLETSNSAANSRLLALETSNTQIRSNISSLYANINLASANNTSIVTALSTTNSNVSSLSTSLATTNSNVSSLSTSLATTNSNVSNLGTNVAAIAFVVDGGGTTIETGNVGDIQIPYSCTITGWTLLADQTGNIVMDIMKDSYANFPPVHADVITGSQVKPRINNGTKNTTSTLTGWSSTTVTAGDILRFNVASITSITRATLVLNVKKTP